MKIPIIRREKYILEYRIRQYICPTDHTWMFIVNRDLEEEPAPTGETSAPPALKTAKQLVAKRNQEREAIKSRFGGNEESKKMQKNVLKHQFENFSTASNESLDKAYDRFQKLISQLKVHGAPISKEDINQKFLRSLPPSWNQIALIMRNKPDIDEIDIDDLYNNLRVYEDEMKRSSSSTSTSQNLAFLSIGEHSADLNNVPHLSQKGPTTSPQLENKDFQQIDEDDLEELDLRWQGNPESVTGSCKVSLEPWCGRVKEEWRGCQWAGEKEYSLTHKHTGEQERAQTHKYTSDRRQKYLQQNGFVERKNMTLIEAARTIPFGCPLTILNTLDSLGKFDGKSDEDQPNMAGTGPTWMFDLDFLTNSMNYIPVSIENQVNVDAGTQDSYVAGSSRKDKGPTQEYILLPLQPHRTRILVEDVAPAAHEIPSESSPKDNDVQDSEDVADKEGQHQMTEDEQVLHDELEKMIAQEVVAKALDDATRQAFEEEKRNIILK
ncbi:hypothetical protein Tco_1227794 [Tanacetum coccineum]